MLHGNLPEALRVNSCLLDQNTGGILSLSLQQGFTLLSVKYFYIFPLCTV